MKLYNDSVHGHIYLPDYCFQWIDTEEFQRLRRIKQLGSVSYVFEGATHTRFGHSIGVAYLAHKMVSSIRQFTEVSDRLIELITISGLLHDIGHGPFSHLYEECMKEIGKEYHHEDMSCSLIENMVEKYSLNYSKKEIEFVHHVIRGVPLEDYPSWCFEIVSNPLTSIDVDKFDYFQRDTKYANVQITYNPSRFFTCFKILNGHIVYPQKELYNIYELYHTRYVLFKTVYYHKVVAQYEVMISDLMKQYVNEDFLKLTDEVIFKNKNKLLERLYKRDIYKTLWEGVFKSTDKTWEKIKELKSDDIHIYVRTANFTKNENPLNKVLFCDKDENVFVLKDTKTSMLMVENFEEVIVRIISKNNHENNKLKVQEFVAKNNLSVKINYR